MYFGIDAIFLTVFKIASDWFNKKLFVLTKMEKLLVSACFKQGWLDDRKARFF